MKRLKRVGIFIDVFNELWVTTSWVILELDFEYKAEIRLGWTWQYILFSAHSALDSESFFYTHSYENKTQVNRLGRHTIGSFIQLPILTKYSAAPVPMVQLFLYQVSLWFNCIWFNICAQLNWNVFMQLHRNSLKFLGFIKKFWVSYLVKKMRWVRMSGAKLGQHFQTSYQSSYIS